MRQTKQEHVMQRVKPVQRLTLMNGLCRDTLPWFRATWIQVQRKTVGNGEDRTRKSVQIMQDHRGKAFSAEKRKKVKSLEFTFLEEASNTLEMFSLKM